MFVLNKSYWDYVVSFSSFNSHHLHIFLNCWFARDVRAAMLVIKNKSISVLWEPNSVFMLILREKFYCIDPQHGRLVMWLQTKNASFVV